MPQIIFLYLLFILYFVQLNRKKKQNYKQRATEIPVWFSQIILPVWSLFALLQNEIIELVISEYLQIIRFLPFYFWQWKPHYIFW